MVPSTIQEVWNVKVLILSSEYFQTDVRARQASKSTSLKGLRIIRGGPSNLPAAQEISQLPYGKECVDLMNVRRESSFVPRHGPWPTRSISNQGREYFIQLHSWDGSGEDA